MRERSLKWRNKNFKIENKITSTPYRRMQLTKSLQNKKYDFASNFKSKIEYTKSKYIIDHEQRFIEEGRKKKFREEQEHSEFLKVLENFGASIKKDLAGISKI